MSYVVPRDWYRYRVNKYLPKNSKNNNSRRTSNGILLYSSYVRNRNYAIMRSVSGIFYGKRKTGYINYKKYFKRRRLHIKSKGGGLVDIIWV